MGYNTTTNTNSTYSETIAIGGRRDGDRHGGRHQPLTSSSSAPSCPCTAALMQDMNETKQEPDKYFTSDNIADADPVGRKQ
jgi:hypothetical protein